VSHSVDDPVRVSHETRRKARKRHRCCACLEGIEPGDTYVRTWTVHDGNVVVFKHCMRCNLLFHAIMKRSTEPVLFTLDCDVPWEAMFGDMPDDVEVLAFARPGDFSQ